MRRLVFTKIVVVLLASVLAACGHGWKELALKDRGLTISFPCQYKEKERAAYNCTDDWTYSYTVWVKDPAGVTYDGQLSIYKGFASRSTQEKIGTVSERQTNGYRVIQYDEDEFAQVGGSPQLKKRTRFLDIFKDNFKLEVSAWAARDAKHGNPDLETMLSRDLEPFFASLKLGE